MSHRSLSKEDIKDGDVDNEGLVILLYELSRGSTIFINEGLSIEV